MSGQKTRLFQPDARKVHAILGGGHWGILETAKPKEKSSKTAKKFGQNRKPSKTDTMVTSGAYKAN